MQYHVKTGVFEGPLDLLLSLIEKRKLLINDISLASVADDFLEYIASHPEFPMAETAHFVLVGSTLLLIKSKSLLPVLTLTEEETASIEDLEQRLKLYQRYKELSQHIYSLFLVHPLYARLSLPREPFFSPDMTMTLSALHTSMQHLLVRLPKNDPELKATVKKVMSLEAMIDQLAERIQSSLKTSFHEFSGSGKTDRVNVVVSFLALLELVKRGAIKVEQESHFSDIIMESDAVTMPQYG